MALREDNDPKHVIAVPECIEIVWAWGTVGNDKFLSAADAHFYPGAAAPAGLIIPSARLLGLLYERSSLFAFCRLGGTLRLMPERWCTVTVPEAHGRRSVDV